MVHAESLRVLGMTIPGDDFSRAIALIPKGAEIISIEASPTDFTSLKGFLSRVTIGTTETTICGFVPMPTPSVVAESE